jgi:hypothetical protein
MEDKKIFGTAEEVEMLPKNMLMTELLGFLGRMIIHWAFAWVLLAWV